MSLNHPDVTMTDLVTASIYLTTTVQQLVESAQNFRHWATEAGNPADLYNELADKNFADAETLKKVVKFIDDVAMHRTPL